MTPHFDFAWNLLMMMIGVVVWEFTGWAGYRIGRAWKKYKVRKEERKAS